MNSITLIIYKTKSGKAPYVEWLESLDDFDRGIIRTRVTRLRLGLFTNCKPIKGHKGIYELVIDHGLGYRIYYGKKEQELVILLVGGLKKSQERDIEKAYRYWLTYKE
jgi:putative addiction module killer protein